MFPELNPDKFTRVAGHERHHCDLRPASNDESRELLRGFGMPFKADETEGKQGMHEERPRCLSAGASQIADTATNFDNRHSDAQQERSHGEQIEDRQGQAEAEVFHAPRRRCKMCGRPRAVYRKFGICRICFRKLADEGLIPGVKKASW